MTLFQNSKTGTKVSANILKTKNFCILPWVHFHAWPDGKVFPCCIADSNVPVSSTNSESVIQLVNSEDFKALRLRMLNNEPSEICKRCYELESFGVESLRQTQNHIRGKSSLDLVNKTQPDGTIPDFKLKYMDIRWSNMCNMKCRSCGPSCSSLWAQEFKERHGEVALRNNFGLSKILVSNNEDDKFWEKVEPYLDDVEEVYFAGGESIITPEHYKILDYWLSKGKTNIKITYTTNFSVFKYKNKNVLDYWKKFPQIEISASLDASGPLAEYMRKGTVWADIEENAAMIKREVPHVKFEITPTISSWNVHQFPEFHKDWIAKGFLSKDSGVRINVLTFPWHASFQILPDTFREKMIELYQEVIDDPTFSASVKHHYQTVINALRAGKENKEGVKEFFTFNAKLDQHRKENIYDVLPHLQEINTWTNS